MAGAVGCRVGGCAPGPAFGVAELPAWAYSLAYDDADSVVGVGDDDWIGAVSTDRESDAMVCVGDDDWRGVNGDQPVGRWRRCERCTGFNRTAILFDNLWDGGCR
jgi:hypothetical protein